jgi:SAM-dependent methyltransferase
MNLFDIINRKSPQVHSSDGYAIPFQKQEFSARMLKDYLFQNEGAVTPNLEQIEKQVEWIHKDILKEKSSKILDICCGPGMYSNMLAKLGHRSKGIDFSPAYIEYARITKIELMLDCEFILSDVRNIDYGRDFDLAIFLNGEFNTKSRENISGIMKNLNASLKDNGLLLLELIAFERIENFGNQAPDWKTFIEGVFSAKPYICLNDYEWLEADNRSISRNFIISSDNALVEVYSTIYQAYTTREYDELFSRNGFTIAARYNNLQYNNTRSGLPLYGILLKKTG